MPDLVGDTARGAEVYRTTCAACHGPDGQGNPGFPALWGARSYSVGASMARQERAAAFIWHNMPFGKPRSLTQQQAFDVAAYINAKPRPDLPGKENDWPHGGAPKDVPYDTRSGHRAYLPPPLLPRANAAGAIVPPPPSVVRKGSSADGA
jgi:thiosulfate dehydrogenase